MNDPISMRERQSVRHLSEKRAGFVGCERSVVGTGGGFSIGGFLR
jgi:hypothetical protein